MLGRISRDGSSINTMLLLSWMVMMMLFVTHTFAGPHPHPQGSSSKSTTAALSKERLLVNAIREGDLNQVKDLVRDGADLDYRKGQPLTLAAEAGDVKMVKFLLEAGANPNSANPGEYEMGEALTGASRNNHLDIINILLEAGAVINITPPGNTAPSFPLGAASRKGHLRVVQRLIEAGADAAIRGSDALAYATERGHLEVVKALLAAGADVNAREGGILVLAALEGSLDVVKTIIDAGITETYIRNAATYAALFNSGEMAQELLKHVRDNTEETTGIPATEDPFEGFLQNGAALPIIAINGDIDVVRTFIENGVTPKILSHSLVTSSLYGHLDIVKLLLEEGADPNYVDVLKNAVKSGNIDLVRFLLGAGSNITCEGEEDRACPWHFAAMVGSSEIVALLAEHGAPINEPLIDANLTATGYATSTDAKGWTVMHIAARYGSPIAGKLLDLGTDLNAVDAAGRTPLQVAVKYRKLIIAQQLLTFCPDVSAINNEGKTVFDMAKDLALPTNTTSMAKYQALEDLMKERLPEEFAKTPYNKEGVLALRDKFMALMEANSTLKKTVHEILKAERWPRHHIYNAVQNLLDERAGERMTKIMEDQKCKTLLQDVDAELGANYLFRCECIPGQGPKMTLTLVQQPNLCGLE